jgi:hypothetical protein
MKLRTLAIPTLATLALAACGGDPAQNGAGQPDDKSELAFARCMRAAGINLPDPGGPGAGAQRVELGTKVSPQKLRSATESCRKKTGGGPKPLTEAEQAEFRDAALKFAQCMRRNGVDIPDPQTSSSGGGIVIDSGGKGGGPNPDSPGFQRAQKACEKLLPGKRGAGVNKASGGSGPSFSSSGPGK